MESRQVRDPLVNGYLNFLRNKWKVSSSEESRDEGYINTRECGITPPPPLPPGSTKLIRDIFAYKLDVYAM